LGYRVREAQMRRVQIQLVVGDNEANDHSVTVRRHNQTTQETMSLDAFISAAKKEEEDKK
jgi:threonyl-tRNA synthetase